MVESSNGIHLVLTDVVMPNMGGTELAEHVARLRPHLPVIFMSGYADSAVVTATRDTQGLFLPKPFTAAALIDTIRQALAKPWSAHG